MDVLDGPMDTYSIGNDAKTPENDWENVIRHQNKSKMQYSPNGCEIAVSKPPGQWKQVSVGNGNIYTPHLSCWILQVKHLHLDKFGVPMSQ